MYLLLRDNKQTGPYSAEDLKLKGLKPYDLVWQEGRSAAWRYPGEVEELKAFAPQVEEQPFDRFYKKPAQQAAAQIMSSAGVALRTESLTESPVKETEAPGEAEIPALNRVSSGAAPSVFLPKTGQEEAVPAPPPEAVPAVPNRKIIYVTMPVGKPNQVPTQSAPPETVAGRNAAPIRTEAPETRSRATAVPAGSLAVGSEFLSMPDEEIFHQGGIKGYNPVEKRPHGSSRSVSIVKPLVIAASVFVLLAAGIFIGLSLNGNFRGFSSRAAVVREDGSADRQAVHPAPMPVYTTAATNPGQPDGKESLSNTVISDPGHPQAVKTISEEALRRKTAAAREKAALAAHGNQDMPPATPNRDSALAAAPIVQREASRRTDETGDKEAVKNNIANLVSVSSNKFSTGTFGGITELQVTVSNHSIYPLDLVVVEVQYVQANKKLFKTENLSFRGIGAGSALMVEAPKSSRGVKVQYRIILINSKELGLSYSGI